MKTFRKILALTLTITMIVSLCNFIYATGSAQEFTPFKIGISRLNVRNASNEGGIGISNFGTYFLFDGQEPNLEADDTNQSFTSNVALLVDWDNELGSYVILDVLGSGESKAAAGWDIPDTGFVVMSAGSRLAFDQANVEAMKNAGVFYDADGAALTDDAYKSNLIGQPLYLYGVDPVEGTIDVSGYEFSYNFSGGGRNEPNVYPMDYNEENLNNNNIADEFDPAMMFSSNAYVYIGSEDPAATTSPFVSRNAHIKKAPAIGTYTYGGLFMSHYNYVNGIYAEAWDTADTDDIYDECFIIDPQDYASVDALYDDLEILDWAYAAVLECQSDGSWKLIHTGGDNGTGEMKQEWAYDWLSLDGGTTLRDDRILLCVHNQSTFNDSKHTYGNLTYAFGRTNTPTCYTKIYRGTGSDIDGDGQNECQFIVEGNVYATFCNVDFNTKSVKTNGEWGKRHFASDSYVIFSDKPFETYAYDQRLVPLYKTEVAPTIDGTASEGEYNNDLGESAIWKYKGTSEASEADKTLLATYDDDNLYIAGSISCKTHTQGYLTDSRYDISDELDVEENRAFQNGHNMTLGILSGDPYSDEIAAIVSDPAYDYDKALELALNRVITIAQTDDYYASLYEATADENSELYEFFEDLEKLGYAAAHSYTGMAAVYFSDVNLEGATSAEGITFGEPTFDETAGTVINSYPDSMFASVSADGTDSYEIAIPWSWIDAGTDTVRETGSVFGFAAQLKTGGMLDAEAAVEEGWPDEEAGYNIYHESVYYGSLAPYESTAAYGTLDMIDVAGYQKMMLAGFEPDYIERTLTDDPTAVSVYGKEIDKRVELVVTPIPNDDATTFEKFKDFIGDDALDAFFDVELVGDAVPPFLDTVTVTVPAPGYLDGTVLNVGYYDGERLVICEVSVENGAVSFDTDCLGTFALVAPAGTPVAGENTLVKANNTDGKVAIVGDDDTILKMLEDSDPDLKALIDAAKADNKVVATVIEINPVSPDADTKKLLEACAGENGLTLSDVIFDITIKVLVDNEEVGKITKTAEELKFIIDLASLAKDGREFSLIRVHDAKADLLGIKNEDGTYSSASDLFSVFAVAYKDSTEPTSSTSSSDPTNATNASNNTTNTTKKGGSNESSPVTGDGAMIHLVVCLLSALGLAVLEIRRRSENRI